MEQPATPRIVITDPPPLPRDGRCPTCRSTRRVEAGGFGGPRYPVCADCGTDLRTQGEG